MWRWRRVRKFVLNITKARMGLGPPTTVVYPERSWMWTRKKAKVEVEL